MNPSKPMRRPRGFSLIELAIVLVIIGIIASIGIPVFSSSVETARITKNKALLDRARDALVGYAAAHRRLPCPDTNSNGSENVTSPTTCTASVGTLPYKDLDLADGYDVYHRPIYYGVFTDSSDNADLISNKFGSLDYFCQAVGNASNLTGNSTGYVYITNGGTPSNQAFVVASEGFADKDNNGSLWDGHNEQMSSTNPEFESPSTTVSSTYDDQVVSLGFPELYSRLGCGATQSNVALNIITASTLPSGTANSPYSTQDIRATGGVGSYRWCYVGSLPSGLSSTISENPSASVTDTTSCIGASESSWTSATAFDVSGTPDTAGTYYFKVYARDNNDPNGSTNDHIVSKTFSLTVDSGGGGAGGAGGTLPSCTGHSCHSWCICH